jgi:F-type H+-transporting ATPase subunit delta
MSGRSVARQYASALFSVTYAAGTWQAVGEQLQAFTELVQGHDELRQAFESPAVGRQQRQAIVRALAERAGLAPELGRLLDLMAENGRLLILSDVAAAYRERVMDAEGVMTAEVATAYPIDEARQRALASALSQATGRRVEVTGRVDPAMIGGAIARVGSVVYDGSVAHQLERMRQQLTAQG